MAVAVAGAVAGAVAVGGMGVAVREGEEAPEVVVAAGPDREEAGTGAGFEVGEKSHAGSR